MNQMVAVKAELIRGEQYEVGSARHDVKDVSADGGVIGRLSAYLWVRVKVGDHCLLTTVFTTE